MSTILIKSALSLDEQKFKKFGGDRSRSEETLRRNRSLTNIKLRSPKFRINLINKILDNLKRQHKSQVEQLTLDRCPYRNSF